MAIKQMILIPVYWGEWWAPARGSAYTWADVNAAMAGVVGSRYMDGLNQYGFGRGAVGKSHVYQVDPPSGGFGEPNLHWRLRTAIDSGHVAKPDEFDLQVQQPFYSLIMPPVEQAVPVPRQLAFSYDYGDGRAAWTGLACWVEGDLTAAGTVRRWVREMADACTHGRGEISHRCQDASPVFVDRISVPQYWSVVDNSCWPPSDTPPVERRSQHAVDLETQRHLDVQFERQFQGAQGADDRQGLHRREDD
jgi:hypothetical protein